MKDISTLKYEDRFIYRHRADGRQVIDYRKCEFMCVRPDYNTIIAHSCYSFSSNYIEIKESDFVDILTEEDLIKDFNSKINDLNKESSFLKDFLKKVEEIGEYCEFQTHIRIICELLSQKRVWTCCVGWRNLKGEEYKEFAEKLIRQMDKGIRKHKKRIYKYIKDDADIDMNRINNLKEKIYRYEQKIKDCEKELEGLLSFIRE